MRVALVHDWLVAHRGGEAVLLALARMFPEAPIFTLVADCDKIHPELAQRTIHTSFIQKLPGAPKHFRRYLPLFPRAIESLDLSHFEGVISTSHCVAKGVHASHAIHLSYIHTPMRYAWEERSHYRTRGWRGSLSLPFFETMAHILRKWDVRSSTRPTELVANSEFVRQRILRSWKKESQVVYPPVDTHFFTPGSTPRGNEYVVVGAQVAYKNTALAVQAATQCNLPLLVVGEGPAVDACKAVAGPTVRFAGHVSRDALRNIYRAARGLLFCGVEDFGIVPVEAMACGCPVVALAAGGALETVISQDSQETGVFFAEPNVLSLQQAVIELEELWSEGAFAPEVLTTHARRFSEDTFTQRMGQLLDDLGFTRGGKADKNVGAPG